MQQLVARLRGKSDELLAYEDVREQLRAAGADDGVAREDRRRHDHADRADNRSRRIAHRPAKATVPPQTSPLIENLEHRNLMSGGGFHQLTAQALLNPYFNNLAAVSRCHALACSRVATNCRDES
mgnify:CR=1 FL=1